LPKTGQSSIPVKLDPVDMAGDIGEQAEDGLPSHCQELPGVGPFSKQELNTSTGKYRKCHGTLRMVFPATARNSAELDHSANRN
jgi:hypothetical protein